MYEPATWRFRTVRNLAQIRKQGFHFGAGVLIAEANGSLNALGENGFGVFRAIVLGEGLGVHLVSGNIVRIGLQERAKVGFRGGEIAGIHAFQCEAIESEGVVGIAGEEFFQLLAAGFLLFGHGGVPYYTWRKESYQRQGRKRSEMARVGNRMRAEFREEPLKGKPVGASASEMAEVVLPAQTNALGKLLGGHVMHMVDIVAAMAASRHANSYMVTASVDYIDFRNPVNLGEIVLLKSHVNRVFHTSLEVGVEVFSEDILTGERKHTTSAFVTFVAIDEHTRKPKVVPPLMVKTAEERRRWREAEKRREIRLAHRKREKR